MYRQSRLPEVAELALLLGMITPLGWLERVPTYKERLRDMAERDVLELRPARLSRSCRRSTSRSSADELVPVGEDQVSHLELSREIVRRFNRLYGDVLAGAAATPVRDAADPGSDGRKMSKSLDNTIELERRTPTRSGRSVRSFVTDPQKIRRGDPGRPEICPIFALHGKFSPDDVARIEATCRTGELGCVDCKTILADHLIERFARLPGTAGGRWSARRVSSRDVLAAGADGCGRSGRDDASRPDSDAVRRMIP